MFPECVARNCIRFPATLAIFRQSDCTSKVRTSSHSVYRNRRLTHPGFCEEDFIVTGFIAEFINTCSNAAYSMTCYTVQYPVIC